MNLLTRILSFGFIGYCYSQSQSLVALIFRYAQLNGFKLASTLYLLIFLVF